MDIDEVWAAIDRQRGRTVQLLESLTPSEWDRASLCDGWTVRDVAAHLTLQQLRVRDLPRILPVLLQHPGGTNTLILHWAKRVAAATPTDEIVAQIRAMIGSRQPIMGATPRVSLIDALVHSQDIALPLGRRLDLEADAAAEAARGILASHGTPKNKVFRQVDIETVQLVATDTEFRAGSGPEVRGTMTALLLLTAGRTAALELVSGPGRDLLVASTKGVGPRG